MTRFSPLRGRHLTRYEAAVERFAASSAGSWLFPRVFNPLDRHLLALSHGRLSMAVGAPVGLLETVGVRTQRRRRTPLLYLREHDNVVLVASNVGRDRDPAWLHNLNAFREVRFLSREVGWQTYRGRVVTGPEREMRWAGTCDLYSGYAVYQQRAQGRQLQVVVLEPI
jgi:deazaflavin-dependent oxidoreductase (nitroreductase family)